VTGRGDPGAGGFFVLRTPLLPFGTLSDWGRELAAPRHAGDPAALGEALARDRAMLRARLEETVTSAGFRDAVYVASPALADAIDGWRKDPDSERGLRAEQSLVAYLTRAATRPTPFGLFAGCTTGTIGDRSCLRLPGQESYQRHTRLDMDYLWRLGEAVAADPRLRTGLVYRPNSSLYERGGRLLFLETGHTPAGRCYRLVAVDKTPYLTETLERARAGQRLGALAAALAGDDVTLAEATGYVAELAASQLLIPDTRPQLTGPPPAAALAAALAGPEAARGLVRQLAAVTTQLAAIDAAGIGAAPQRYQDAARLLAGAPAVPEESRFVQVDLTKPAAGAMLGRGVVSELLRGARILHAFSRSGQDDALRQFRDRFTRRYETRELPLAEVLDEESGIGFGRSGPPPAAAAPLLAGLPLPAHREQPGSWTRRDAFLLERVCQAAARGDRQIELTAADAGAVRDPELPPLPDSVEVLAAVAAGSAEAIGSGAFRVLLHSVSGPGARLLGRFCHADGDLLRLVREHLRAEEAAHGDRVYAEVVHLPEGRVGNILCRPVLRGWEIPYLGRSGAPAARQLPVSDLLVSVQGDRIVLRSARLGREVVPRLSTAHNHLLSGPGIYRFLCALQHQGVLAGLTWDWGPLAAAPFLPRVVTGRTVLSRACWNLSGSDLAAFREPRGSQQFAAVQLLRARLGLPRWVALSEAENDLVADLDNVLSVEALAHQAGRQARVRLTEMFPGPGELCVSGPEGRFTHQLIVPLITRPPAPPGQPAPLPPAARQQRRAGPAAARQHRSFPPGSEWLYLSLFAGPATADLVLLRAAPVLAAALAEGAADRWFFVRYGDPDWHLRLRVHGEPARLLGGVLPQLHTAFGPLAAAGLLWRTQLDTYEREIERYGGDRGIGPAERVFHADSEAALTVVSLLRGDAAAALRWQVALRGIDLLFSDLGLTLPEKRALARRARTGYEREFAVGGSFQRVVSQRFRQQRAALEGLLDPAREPPPELAGSMQALQRRSAALAPAAAEIRGLAAAGELPASLPDLAMSFAHMHVNRLLRTAPRAQELVLYELLDRLYAAQAARAAPPPAGPAGAPLARRPARKADG
jgi:thiopeptide-type bacteriocin biosynthesis protein